MPVGSKILWGEKNGWVGNVAISGCLLYLTQFLINSVPYGYVGRFFFKSRPQPEFLATRDLLVIRLFPINSLGFRKELTDLYTPVQIFQ